MDGIAGIAGGDGSVGGVCLVGVSSGWVTYDAGLAQVMPLSYIRAGGAEQRDLWEQDARGLSG